VTAAAEANAIALASRVERHLPAACCTESCEPLPLLMRGLRAGRRHLACSSHVKAESAHQEAKEEAMQQNVPLTWTATWLLFTTLATAGVLGTYGRTTNDAARQLMGTPARVQRTGLAGVPVGQRFASGRSTLSRKEAVVLLMLLQGIRPTLAR